MIAEKSDCCWLTPSRPTVTCFAFSLPTMNAETLLLWDESGGTVRKKNPVRVPSVVIVVFVAEPETKPRPAPFRAPVVAFTSFEPAGPTTPSTFEFEPSACAPLTASAVPLAEPSIVSSLTNLIFVLCVRLYWLLKKFAQCTWLIPIEAAGPVNGAISPIRRVLPHLTRALPAFDAEDAPLGAFADPQAAVASTAIPAARTAAITSFLMLPSCSLPRPRLRPHVVRRQRSSFVCLVPTRSRIAGRMKNGDDPHG